MMQFMLMRNRKVTVIIIIPFYLLSCDVEFNLTTFESKKAQESIVMFR